MRARRRRRRRRTDKSGPNKMRGIIAVIMYSKVLFVCACVFLFCSKKPFCCVCVVIAQVSAIATRGMRRARTVITFFCWSVSVLCVFFGVLCLNDHFDLSTATPHRIWIRQAGTVFAIQTPVDINPTAARSVAVVVRYAR